MNENFLAWQFGPFWIYCRLFFILKFVVTPSAYSFFTQNVGSFGWRKSLILLSGIMLGVVLLIILATVVFAYSREQGNFSPSENSWKDIHQTLCASEESLGQTGDTSCGFSETEKLQKYNSAPVNQVVWQTSSVAPLPQKQVKSSTTGASVASSQAVKGTLKLDKLAKAVSVAETGGCLKGSALSVKNCFGIMEWDARGRRFLKTFKSHQASFTEFKRIWGTYYKKFPNQALANIWVNGDPKLTTEGSRQWLLTVIQIYQS